MTRLMGKCTGLKAAEIGALEKLLRRRVPPSLYVSFELAREMTGLADAIGRPLGVTLDRRGRVRGVWVGEPNRILPVGLEPARTGPGRFSGLRFVCATAHRQGATALEATETLRLKLDAWVRVESTGRGGLAQVWVLIPDPRGVAAAGEDHRLAGVRTLGPLDPHALPSDFLEAVGALEEELEWTLRAGGPAGSPERALLLGQRPWRERRQGLESLDELEDLARSALMEVVARELQCREHPDGRSWLGKGFLEELVHQAARVGATLLVADGPLSPGQARNLAQAVGLPVLDRVGLILRIFERRAQSRDARRRVELARLRYELSRIRGRGGDLSQIGGTSGGASGSAPGVKGKGEQRIELDRRHLRTRIRKLEVEIERRGTQRREAAKARVRSGVPIVSLVGYTNAGKTTLFNALTGADALAEDLLFATLDPRARRLYLPGSGRGAVLTDTVGFLRELPPGLLEAFRATLEQLGEADLLIHVIDLSAPAFQEQKRAVEETLAWLQLKDLPRLDVYNKADLVDRAALAPVVDRLGGLVLSALDLGDCRALAGRIEEQLERMGALARDRADRGSTEDRGNRP